MLAAMAHNRYPERDEALLVWGVLLGYRISEQLSIFIREVVSPAGEVYDDVTVPASRMKNKRDRRVSINLTAARYLRAWLGHPAMKDQPGSRPVFMNPATGKRITRQTAWDIIKTAAVNAGIDPRRVGTHSFRKTAGWKVYIESGRDILVAQQFLGHASPQMTIKYLEIAEQQVDQVVGRIGI